jgi:lipopolysaccharide export system protein LptA
MADKGVFYLGPENQVERVLATGDVTTQTRLSDTNRSRRAANVKATSAVQPPAPQMRSRSDQAEFLLEGKQDLLRTATMTGEVHIEQTGSQPMQGDAGRVVLDFTGQNQLQKVHALDGVRLTQKTVAASQSTPKNIATGPQDFELVAPIIDFTVAQGHILQQAVTSGAAQISIAQAQPASLGPAQVPTVQRTVVTAGKFLAQFGSTDGRNRLVSVHGAPDARIVNSTPGEPDRVSTSESVDATFLPQGGIDSITQQGNVVYTDGQPPDKRMQAWAHSGRYIPAERMLVLTGNPRVANGGMATTAETIRINRATGDAFAKDDVKSTYSELKEQPDGALLASASPIHVTAQSMTAHSNSGIALYSGNTRLWQDANVIEAPAIEFDRDRRFVTAQGTPAQPVQTILVQAEKAPSDKIASEKTLPAEKKGGKKARNAAALSGSSPISITAAKLTYADSERRVHYEGGVTVKGADFTASAKTLDAYLLPHSQTTNNQSFAGPGQLDRMVAQNDVIIQQPKHRAEGQNLVYTAADDKFVLTGGPPSIFDAEQGKITGVSLTFFRRDDRVLVEGEASTPVVTQTRVAR